MPSAVHPHQHCLSHRLLHLSDRLLRLRLRLRRRDSELLRLLYYHTGSHTGSRYWLHRLHHLLVHHHLPAHTSVVLRSIATSGRERCRASKQEDDEGGSTIVGCTPPFFW